jgi:hypothetical protein
MIQYIGNKYFLYILYTMPGKIVQYYGRKSRQIACGLCGTDYGWRHESKDWDKALKHCIEKHSDRLKKCKICGEQFLFPDWKRNHEDSKHADDDRIKLRLFKESEQKKEDEKREKEWQEWRALEDAKKNLHKRKGQKEGDKKEGRKPAQLINI